MKILSLLEMHKKNMALKGFLNADSFIFPPEDVDNKISTLSSGTYRPLSQMLRERFDFCGEWKNAYLSQDWLPLSSINNWGGDKKISDWVNIRKENSYPGDLLEDHPPENVSIFSINPYEPEEIYLLWGKDGEEPQVWHYFGADFYTFNNLEKFLLYVNGIIGDEDTVRK